MIATTAMMTTTAAIPTISAVLLPVLSALVLRAFPPLHKAGFVATHA